MSWVRWSTKVRDECKQCQDTGYIKEERKDVLEGLPTTWLAVLDGTRLCPNCSSCWYIYTSTEGGITLMHRGCDGDESFWGTNISFKEAENYELPEEHKNCTMQDVLQQALKDALEYEKNPFLSQGR